MMESMANRQTEYTVMFSQLLASFTLHPMCKSNVKSNQKKWDMPTRSTINIRPIMYLVTLTVLHLGRSSGAEMAL